ncbi:MAG: histidine kinase [Gemmatimonadales bacterium]|nr:histidine kinase [Gemmatimonadales bacterium]
MASPERPAPRAATWLLLAVFGALTLLTAAQGYLSRKASGEAARLGDVLAVGAAAWVGWLCLAPLIIALGRRIPFSRTTWLRATVVHTLAMTVCYVVSVFVLIWISLQLLSPTEALTREMITRTLLTSSRLSLAIFTYVTILALDHVLLTREALRLRELQASRLEATATQARLDALAARLEPHFLFNALQSVSALIDSDPARARTMLAQIGDLLRDALASPESGEVSVHEERRLLGRYLAIEETRFADRLHVEWVVAPDTEAVMVPRFLLQPIVENALRHGLAVLPEGGRLRITATREPQCLRLIVWNDGAPLPATPREGVGLATTRERLAARYGVAASLTLRAAEAGGVETVIELPA